MKGQTVLTLVVIAVAAAAGVIPAASPAAAEGGPRIGQRAPEITGGPWINSEPLSLQKLRGRVVYVEFWTYG